MTNPPQPNGASDLTVVERDLIADDEAITADEVEALVREYDSESNFRNLVGPTAMLVTVASVALSLFHVYTAGFGVLKATAHTKLLNFASNLGSLLVFAFSGATWWMTGLAMALGQVAGAALGARLAMRVGARMIRPLLVVTSTAMALRLIWQAMA